VDAAEIIQTVRDAGVTGLLIFALIGGFRQWWVFGWHHREVVKERDEWKSLALHGTHLSERSIEVAKRVVTSEVVE
jgi:hypothetical protein